MTTNIEIEDKPDIPLPAAIQKVISLARSRPGLTALAVVLLTLLFYKLTLFLPSRSSVLVYVSTLCSIPLVVALCVSLTRCMRNAREMALHFVLSLAAIFPQMLPLIGGLIPKALLPAFVKGFHLYVKLMAAAPGLRGIIMIWFATVIGVLVSRLVKEMKLLLPMGVTLALIDLYVVFGGGLVTQATSGKNPAAAQLMNAMTVNLPRVAPKGGAAPLQLAIGFADFLFIALFFACFQRFKVPSTKTFIVLCGLLVVYMGVVAVFGIPLPALVPIAVVVIGMNFRRFKYERSEAFAMLYAGLILVAAIGVILWRSGKGH